MRKLLACAALCAALVSTSVLADSVTARMSNPTTIGNVGLANSTAVLMNNVQAATGLGTIYSNVNGYQLHYITITTTGAPTYVATLVGCYEATCAATNQTVNIISSGSVTTSPLVLNGGGFYPFLVVNIASLSGGSITVTYSGSTQAAARTDADGRGLTGNSDRPTYWSSFAVTVPTAAGSLAAIEADANNKLRLRYIKVCLGVGALQTTAGERQLVLFRTTAASSGGSAATPTVVDNSGVVADPAFGGVARNGAITTTPAVGSVTVANAVGWTGTFAFTVAGTTTTPQCSEKVFDVAQMKAPASAAGVANGLAIADITGGAGGAGLYNIDLGWTVEAN